MASNCYGLWILKEHFMASNHHGSIDMKQAMYCSRLVLHKRFLPASECGTLTSVCLKIVLLILVSSIIDFRHQNRYTILLLCVSCCCLYLLLVCIFFLCVSCVCVWISCSRGFINTKIDMIWSSRHERHGRDENSIIPCDRFGHKDRYSVFVHDDGYLLSVHDGRFFLSHISVISSVDFHCVA